MYILIKRVIHDYIVNKHEFNFMAAFFVTYLALDTKQLV